MNEDRLITSADLKRHLPEELPFHGRILKRDWIGPWLDGPKPNYMLPTQRNGAYVVHYKCEGFFNCSDRQSAFSILDPPDSERAHRLEQLRKDNETLLCVMRIDCVPIKQLPDLLRERLRGMYWHLEDRIEHEAVGRLLDPAGSGSRR